MRVFGGGNIGFIYYGPGFQQYTDRELSIGLIRRRSIPEGELQYRLTLTVTWNWRPGVERARPSIGSWDEYCAAAWTGRLPISRWSWPFFVSVNWIED